MNSIKHYALRDGINPRKAQRYRKKLNIGQWIGGETGSWIITEKEWSLIFKACTDANAKGTKSL